MFQVDLQVFVNLLTKRDGHRAAISVAISIAFLGAVSLMFGQMLRYAPDLLRLEDEVDVAGMSSLFSGLLMPALLLTMWFGFGGGRRQLFERPQLDLLLSAPVRTAPILLATLLRFSFLTTLWCTALCGPMLAAASAALDKPLSWFWLVVSLFCLTVPITAVLLVFQICVLRWFSSRVAQIGLGIFSTVASMLFSLFLLVGALAQQGSIREIVSLARGGTRFPGLIRAPAELLADYSMHGEIGFSKLAAAALGPICGVGIIVATFAIYRRAYANAQQAYEPLMKARARRSWPSRAAPALLRKEIAQIVHQPTQLFGLLFSTVVIIVVAGSRFIDQEVFSAVEVPEAVHHTFLMLGLWLFAQITVVPGCLLRLTVADGAQWPLYVGCPATAWTILRGKLYAVALLQTWPAAVTLLVGLVLFRASWTSIAVFAALVPIGVIWVASATGAIGTLPFLMRPRPERNHALALISVVIMLFALQATAVPGVQAWMLCADYYAGRGPMAMWSETKLIWTAIAAVWFAGGVFSMTALLIGVRNLTALTAPARS